MITSGRLKGIVGQRLLSLLGVCACFATASANPVLDWSALMMAAIRTDNTGPTLSSRNLAILNVSTYDAVNSILRTHQPCFTQIDASADASIEAAVIAAGREVMLALYPPFAARAEELYETQVAGLPAIAATTNGLAVGREVSLRVIAHRSADGASTDVPYIPSAAPGQWQRTAPFFRPPLTPQWRYVETFCLPELDRFLPKPPPALDSEEYALALNEVKEIGGKGSTVRTEEQRLIAVFWSDFSYTAMPPGHWHEIAASISRNRNTSVAECARLFAWLGMSQADAAIVCWEAKFRWNVWRPITAIRRAAEDANPLTEPDAAWDHYLASPPFPAYTSGHSTFSKASAQVLTSFYGTDAITFTAQSDSVPGVFRTYQSLATCADEIGMSRIYGGIHFPFDNSEGKRTGGMIADYVTANYLLPNDSLPLLRVEGVGDTGPQLRVHGQVGQTVMLEASADLKSWEAFSTNIAAIGGVVVRDTAAQQGGRRFYRARK